MVAGDEGGWWVRRAVLAALAVLGVVTAVFAVVAVRSGDAPAAEEADLGEEAVSAYTLLADPTASVAPLRYGRLLVAGQEGAPVEHLAGTLPSFEAAMEAGVDYLEAPVVASSDGLLVVLPSHDLAVGTDVASRPDLADRRTTKTVDGQGVTSWFSEDFTLAELQTLHATERDPGLRPQTAAESGTVPLLSLDDLLVRLDEVSAQQSRQIGLVVEPRQAAYFRSIGMPLEKAVAQSLRLGRLNIEPELATVQSDDPAVLRRVDANLGENVLTSFIVRAGDAGALDADRLAALPEGVDAVSVEVAAFEGQDPYALADRVHDAGLALGVFPISYENARLAPGFRKGTDPAAPGNLLGQVEGLQLIGVDLVLTESPQQVREAIAALAEGTGEAPTEEPSETPTETPTETP
ncbi:glycerophosphodiester phosphodiesterase family protein [Nocardioides litoris]|uniref:glycerophosphodiester phosphodiesterase family protein n=1 Tax=Nocardioides litoris TaxID=1926648 RepID=UPI001120E424|nr:glycerophosphodiester phosphodiesterase family protein [Nocardioides litoris]